MGYWTFVQCLDLPIFAYWEGGWVMHQGEEERGAEDIPHSKAEINHSRL